MRRAPWRMRVSIHVLAGPWPRSVIRGGVGASVAGSHSHAPLGGACMGARSGDALRVGLRGGIGRGVGAPERAPERGAWMCDGKGAFSVAAVVSAAPCCRRECGHWDSLVPKAAAAERCGCGTTRGAGGRSGVSACVRRSRAAIGRERLSGRGGGDRGRRWKPRAAVLAGARMCAHSRGRRTRAATRGPPREGRRARADARGPTYEGRAQQGRVRALANDPLAARGAATSRAHALARCRARPHACTPPNKATRRERLRVAVCPANAPPAPRVCGTTARALEPQSHRRAPPD